MGRFGLFYHEIHLKTNIKGALHTVWHIVYAILSNAAPFMEFVGQSKVADELIEILHVVVLSLSLLSC